MRYLILPCSLLCLAACGSSSTHSNSNDSNNTAVAAASSNQAAQAGAESADGSANGDSAANAQPLAFKVLPSSSAVNGNFLFDGCVASVAGTLTGTVLQGSIDANVTVSGTQCSTGRTVTGWETIAGTVNGNTRTWDITVDANVTLSSGDVITITSLDTNASTYSLTAVGYGDANATVTLNANITEHRTRHTANGNAVYDMNISTSSPLDIQDIYDSAGKLATRVLVSGSNAVHHNLAKYTAVNTYASVSRTVATCNCPDSGTLTQQITLDADSPLGTGTFDKSYAFSGCGTGTFTVTASTTSAVATTGETATGTFVWDACNVQ